MRFIVFLVSVLLTSSWAAAEDARFNYAEALQKSLYFYEAQQSGRLSPNNRVAWRGPACLGDGQDIGRDLSGGWFDAGDQWTANLTMSFAAMTLAWSAVEHPEAYRDHGQMPALVENLIHVNDYFVRCVLNPECRDPALELEVAIGCGGREGVDPPQVHAVWAAAEVADRMTHRPTFRLNQKVPGGDIPAAMAAAMAASSMVIREQAEVLRGRRGFEAFDATAFADLLLNRAEQLTRFARAQAGPVLTEKLPKEEQERIRHARQQALRSDGKVVEIGYRADPWDKIVAAASWLQRAHRARNPAADNHWFDLAVAVYENEYKAEQNHDWWKDFGAGNFGKLAAFNLMRLAPTDPRFHGELQLYASRFCEYKQSPGGLRLREPWAHEYGSLRHANNAAVIALYYSDHVDTTPPIPGNTWWKANRSNSELRDLYRSAARRTVDYALGENPYHRSYLVGFGQDPFNHVHHRGAYAPWAGFDHFIPGKADDRATNRHILYGALVAGPDSNDVFLCGNRRQWLPVPGTQDSDVFYRFASRTTTVRKTGYVWSADDPPYQDVMDSQFNEVALDYNAGITASFAWLLDHQLGKGGPLPEAKFPPREERNLSEDLRTTDREFFVAARRIQQTQGIPELEFTLWNRSRWPARVHTNLCFRYEFTVPPGAAANVESVQLSGSPTARVQSVTATGQNRATVEIGFPGDAIFPGNAALASRTVRVRMTTPGWNPDQDPIGQSIGTQPALIPTIPVQEITPTGPRRLSNISAPLPLPRQP